MSPVPDDLIFCGLRRWAAGSGQAGQARCVWLRPDTRWCLVLLFTYRCGDCSCAIVHARLAARPRCPRALAGWLAKWLHWTQARRGSAAVRLPWAAAMARASLPCSRRATCLLHAAPGSVQAGGIALSCTHCKRAHTVRSVVELKGAAKDAETSTQARDLCCSVLVLVLASRHVYVRCVCQ